MGDRGCRRRSFSRGRRGSSARFDRLPERGRNLENAHQDIQGIIGDLGDTNRGQYNKRTDAKESRGSRSMMNLNFDEDHWSRRSPGDKKHGRHVGDCSGESFQQRGRGQRMRGSGNSRWKSQQGREWSGNIRGPPQPPFPENQGPDFYELYDTAMKIYNQESGVNSYDMMPPYGQGPRPPHHQNQPRPSYLPDRNYPRPSCPPYQNYQPNPPYQPDENYPPDWNHEPRPPFQPNQRYQPSPPHHQNHQPRPPRQSHRPQNSKGSKQRSYPQDDRHSNDGECGERYISPPPSYEESNLEYGIRLHPSAPSLEDIGEEPIVPDPSPAYGSPQQPFGEGEKPAQRVQHKLRLYLGDLVKALATLKGQRGTAEELGRTLQRSVEEVVKVAKYRKDIFSLSDEKSTIIELIPRVSLCTNYSSKYGCVSRDSCKDLHLCKFFIIGFCSSGISCQYGHKMDTDHNTNVLSKFYIDAIDKYTLHSVIKKACKGSVLPLICSFYNREQRCKNGERCGNFHICKDYVVGCGKCFVQNCSLNHNIFSDHCTRLLKCYGVSTNNSVRDILMNLKSPDENKDGEQTRKSKGKNKQVKKSKRKDDDGSSSSDNDSDSDYSVKSDAASRSGSRKMNRRGHKNIKKPQKKMSSTIEAMYVNGDVEIPEICLSALKGRCVKEKQGCRYLHAKRPYHWQAVKDGKWYNFRIFHSVRLEKAYQDVSKDEVQLPPLYPDKLEFHAKELLRVFGTVAWTADFKAMVVRDSSTKNLLKIRRVSTKSAAVCGDPMATVYEWYFLDKQNNWIRYGDVDSVGKQKYVCSSCEEIEKQYTKDPSSPMTIANSCFSYKIDFKQMTQTNQVTGMVREVRRRPKSSHAPEQLSVPSHWISKPQSETSNVVSLDNSDVEYQNVVTRLRLTLPLVNVHKIERLQNQHLWQQLQLTKESLSKRYNEMQMNVQKLFHGANPANMKTICRENIDWRQGNSICQVYGKGTYFSNSAAIAYKYCTEDENGHLYLLLVEVIVGTIVEGDPAFTRPPLNANTGHLYDTTVDDIHAPKTFVKYEKGEYYPEYIIEFS